MTLLTPVERAVLEAAAWGMSDAETARWRRCSLYTVKQRRVHVLRKLGAKRMSEAVYIALERGLIDPL